MTDIRSTDAELRALAADMPGSVELGLSELVARVFATDSTQLRSEDGAEYQCSDCGLEFHVTLPSV